MVQYRTEAFSGSGERDALSVLLFETCELGNTDALETLAYGVLCKRPIRRELMDLTKRINSGTDVSINEVKNVYKRALDEIKAITGIEVRYALWLANKQQVEDYYWRWGHGVYSSEEECPKPNEGDIVGYQTGPIILSDLGADGTLYGYKEPPKPVKKSKHIFAQNDMVK